MDPKFRLDVEMLESFINLAFFVDINSYDRLTNELLRTFLDYKEEEYRKTVKYEGLEDLITSEIQINMKEKDAAYHMQLILFSCKLILIRHGT